MKYIGNLSGAKIGRFDIFVLFLLSVPIQTLALSKLGLIPSWFVQTLPFVWLLLIGFIALISLRSLSIMFAATLILIPYLLLT